MGGVSVDPDRRFFIAGARPVKSVPLPDGGLAIRKMDLKTGIFVYGMDMYALCLSSDPNVDELSEDEFVEIVERVRAKLYRGDDELGELYRRVRHITDAADGHSVAEAEPLPQLVHRTYALFQARHPDEGP
jgi:hypothetical protein